MWCIFNETQWENYVLLNSRYVPQQFLEHISATRVQQHKEDKKIRHL
jgi:hypothetical protein